MKSAKKILMVILAASLIACCFWLPTSAQSDSVTVDDIAKAFDYTLYDSFLVEDYGNEAGSYVFDNSYFNFYSDYASLALGLEDNAYLKVSYSPESSEQSQNVLRLVDYRMENLTSNFPKTIVSSFKVKLGNENGENGAKVALGITYKNDNSFMYPDEVQMVTIDCLDSGNAKITYPSYNEKFIIYEEERLSLTPSLNAWYNVEVVMNNLDGEYSLTVKDESGSVLASVNAPAIKAPGIETVKFYVLGNENVAADAAIDDLQIYEGTTVRDVVNPDVTLANLIINIDEMANDDDLSLSDRFKIADFYKSFFISNENPDALYTLPSADVLEASVYERVSNIKNNAQAYINQASARALIECVPLIEAQSDYYAKIDYRDDVVNQYYEKMKAVSDLASFAGMNEFYKNEVTFLVAVEKALKEFEAVSQELEMAEIYTIDFVAIIEDRYDETSKDYNHMLEIYNVLRLFADGVIPEYKYVEYNEASIYETADEAYEKYEELSDRIAQIEENVVLFKAAVSRMEIEKASGVSATSPYLTTNFTELYDYYLSAESVYVNGTIHPSLDPKTYNKGETALTDIINDYIPYKNYVEERVAESEAFIFAVNSAASSNYYVTIRTQLDTAFKYLDDEIEYSLENYSEVAEAITLYGTTCEKADKIYADAMAYVAAVNEININAGYAQLKTAVANAEKLRASGFVVGIEASEQAEMTFINAKSKIDALVGSSNTLISAVAAIEDAETLAERRNLINVAKSVEAGAENAVEGVSAAKAKLASIIESYNAEIKAANGEYDSAVENAFSVSSSLAPQVKLYRMFEIITNILK